MFDTQPLSRSERAYVEGVITALGGRRRIRVKRCWLNSQRMMLFDDGGRFQYWECVEPVPHAWVTINGKVVDVTHEAVERWAKRNGIESKFSLHDYKKGVCVRRSTVIANFPFMGFSVLIWTLYPKRKTWKPRPRRNAREYVQQVKLTAEQKRRSARLFARMKAEREASK